MKLLRALIGPRGFAEVADALVDAGLLMIVQCFVAEVKHAGVEAFKDDHIVDFMGDLLDRCRELDCRSWGWAAIS